MQRPRKKPAGFAIQYLEDAPPEAQKSLIQALIKDIYVYSDRLVINMYVDEPLEGILPGEIASTNEKRPTEDCKALVPTTSLPSVSDSCQQWLPELDARRTSQLHIVHMVVRIYTRRSRKQLIRFGDPLPEKPIRAKRIIKNTIYEGLKIQTFINNGPGRITWVKARKELNISEAKLAHLLKIVNTLPPDFVENMRSCTNEDVLKVFNGRRLLKISRLKTDKERRAEIEHLLPRT